MSPRMRKIIALVVALFVAMGLGILTPGSANAAGGGPYCPSSPNEADGVLVSDSTINVITGGMATSGPLIMDDAAGIVCVQGVTDQGYAFDNYDGTVSYTSNPGSSGTDQFTVGATDGDKYYSVTVTVNITAVNLPSPTLVHKLVTKRVKVGKKGHKHYVTKVVRKAVVKFTNPVGSSLKERVMFGSFKSQNPDGMRLLASGTSSNVKTKRASLDFLLTVVDASGMESLIKVGSINTKTGKVKLENLMGSVLGRMTAHQRAVAITHGWMAHLR